MVRQIASGKFPEGASFVSWDGTDAAERFVAADLYFLNTETVEKGQPLKDVVLR